MLRNELIWLVLFIVVLTKFSQGTSNCWVDTTFTNILEYSDRQVFVIDCSSTKDSLRCAIGDLTIQAKKFRKLSNQYYFSWKNDDWLCIKMPSDEDFKYSDDLKEIEYCKSVQKGCLSPPIVLNSGAYTNIDEHVNFSAVNKFAVKVSDSSGIALYIDTLFDGKGYGPNRKKTLDKSKIEKFTYDVIVEIKSLKKYPARMQFSTQFESYPEFTLYHFTDDWGMFILQGKAIDSDVIKVYECAIDPFGICDKKEFTDLFIGDEAIHQTDYFIEDGVLKRKVMSLDEKSRHPRYNKAKFHHGWLPDN